MIPADRVGPYRTLDQLHERDILWLRLLSHGTQVKNLPGIRTEQAIKNRLGRIRWFLECVTTTQAVAEAIRRGIIV